MNRSVKVSNTYLYKIHSLSNLLNRVFDHALRTHAGITLSQFMVLLAIGELHTANQRQIARFLEVSPVAVKRQVDLATHRNRVGVTGQSTGRGEQLRLTAHGAQIVASGLQALDQHVFKIFDAHNNVVNLMQHLDALLDGAKQVLSEQDKGLRGKL